MRIFSGMFVDVWRYSIHVRGDRCLQDRVFLKRREGSKKWSPYSKFSCCRCTSLALLCLVRRDESTTNVLPASILFTQA